MGPAHRTHVADRRGRSRRRATLQTSPWEPYTPRRPAHAVDAVWVHRPDELTSAARAAPKWAWRRHAGRPKGSTRATGQSLGERPNRAGAAGQPAGSPPGARAGPT